MHMEDMILISVDDHVVEPPTMFDRHTPAAYKGRMPKMVKSTAGWDMWVFNGAVIPSMALNAVVGRPPEEYGVEPTELHQLRKGTYDAAARIDDMNVNGQLAGTNFPSFVGMYGSVFLKEMDRDLALAALRAYNDWHIDEWCGAHPGRFMPMGLVPLWDVDLAAQEVKRITAKGCYAISFPPFPSRDGLPSLHAGGWEPLMKVCDERGVIICAHISDATGTVPSMESPVDVFITNMPVTLYAAAADFVFSPLLRKYKNLKVALTEGGAGWVPHFLERIDFVYKHHHAWTRQDFGNKLPSDIFKEHIVTCFIDDKAAVKMRDVIGINNMTWEGDYPHSDSVWPRVPEVLWESMKDLPKAEVDQITHLNAMRLFNFDPFKHIKREDCTVGALRAKSKHVDISTRGQTGGRPASDSHKGPVSFGDVTKQMNPEHTRVQVKENA